MTGRWARMGRDGTGEAEEAGEAVVNVLIEQCTVPDQVPVVGEFRMTEKRSRDVHKEEMVVFQTRNGMAWTKVSKVKRKAYDRDSKEVKL